jgi:hypothetical protein
MSLALFRLACACDFLCEAGSDRLLRVASRRNMHVAPAACSPPCARSAENWGGHSQHPWDVRAASPPFPSTVCGRVGVGIAVGHEV